MSGCGPAHRPVLLAEVLLALEPRPGGTYLDGTFGAGGYSRAILAAAPCNVIAIDRDPDAIAAGRALEDEMSGRLTLIEGRYSAMAALLAGIGIHSVDGVALDIGVSSMQLDRAERGFSFREDGPLDMRMEGSGPSAADIVNETPEADLAALIFRYGEERRSRQVARAIAEARRARPFTRTLELAEVVARVVRAEPGRHPATRTFQALRIAVNDELGELERGLAAAEGLLRAGGRLAVVTFHSLEDRIVKRFLKERSSPPARPSRHLPERGEASARPSFRLLYKGAVEPGETELAGNPRARSARLRAAERTDAPAFALQVAA
ncbi:MAG: 16S rRNA (cytosine(1402)-N(4))-methyltransferase RsmH [Alphaproteobacteria bacterium]|nr:16S rRNA (cytosine(1402)-N(4))-methyltransferase RsmH [Alphaproteobacteria bacterium]